MSSNAAPIVNALILEVCARNPDLAPDEVDPDAELLGAGYLDSLSATEFLSHVEQVYGVVLSVDRLVGDLATTRAIAEHLVATRAAAC